jgi:hypothetical protein
MGVAVMVIEGLASVQYSRLHTGLQCGQLEAAGWGVECGLTRMNTDESLPKHSFASKTLLTS